MNRLTLLFIALIAFKANATIEKIPVDNKLVTYKTMEELDLEKSIFETEYLIEETLDIETLEIVEIDEEVEINFDTKKYLPEGFNALEGKDDIDWNSVELIELEEEVDLGFETKPYLPKNFNALKGKNDLDWSSIELIELEEEVEIGFDTKAHLPKGFNPYKGMNCGKEVVVCLY